MKLPKFRLFHHPVFKSFHWWLPIVIYLVIFASLTIFGNLVRADTLTLHLASSHVSDVDYDFNETNVGVGYGHTLNRHVRLIGGGYYNSLKKVSLYAGINPYLRINTPILTEVGMDAGVLTGYQLPLTPGVHVYGRIFDSFKVGIQPLVWESKLEGYVVTLGLTFGE